MLKNIWGSEYKIDYYEKAERQRMDAFELWCWRKLLRVPWTARNPTSPS